MNCVLELTPETESNILSSFPVVDEKCIFRGPGPTSIVFLLGGEPMVDTYPVLYPGQNYSINHKMNNGYQVILLFSRTN